MLVRVCGGVPTKSPTKSSAEMPAGATDEAREAGKHGRKEQEAQKGEARDEREEERWRAAPALMMIGAHSEEVPSCRGGGREHGSVSTEVYRARDGRVPCTR